MRDDNVSLLLIVAAVYYNDVNKNDALFRCTATMGWYENTFQSQSSFFSIHGRKKTKRVKKILNEFVPTQ